MTSVAKSAAYPGCAVFEYQLWNNGDRRFTEWNDAARILQLCADEVRADGRIFTERIHETDRRRLERAEASLLSGDATMSLRLRLSVDGRFRSILLRGCVRSRSTDHLIVGGLAVDLCWPENRTQSSTHLSRVDDQHILRSLRTLFEEERLYIDEDLSLDKLARRLHLSTHQMSEFLNRRLGVSYAEFVNRYRVAEACRLLRERPDLSLIDICFESGFRSKGAFHTVFRQMTGTTPRHYRRLPATAMPRRPLQEQSLFSLYKAGRQSVANMLS